MAQNEAVKPLEPLSARAVGVYVYMVQQGSYATAEELAKEFKEGRDAMRGALKELRTHGLITTKKIKLESGRIMTVSTIVPPPKLGYRTLKSRPLNSLNIYKAISNIYNKLLTISSSNKQLYSWKNISADAESPEYTVLNVPAGGKVSTDYDDYLEDQEADSKMWKDERQAEFESKKRKKFKKKNHPGCVSEFIQRVESNWRYKPWQQGDTSTFAKVYADARRTYETNTEIELKMMDLYFDSIKHNTEISDPSHIWKRFITMYETLSRQVKNTMLSDEELEQAKTNRAKSVEKLFDV